MTDNETSHLIDTPQSLVANLAGNLMAPLLNRAAIKADYRSANARQVQAVFEYKRSILQAFTDVYNHLTAISNLRQRYQQLAQQVEALHAAIEVSRALYQSAQVDYYEVLMTVVTRSRPRWSSSRPRRSSCRRSSRSTRRSAAPGGTAMRHGDQRLIARVRHRRTPSGRTGRSA